MTTETISPASVIAPDAFLQHWQGHRRLTRRVIEAFPDEELFRFSIGGMRPFGALAMEMISMAAPMVRGVATETWEPFSNSQAQSREEILRLWDDSTQQMNELWPQISPARFHESTTAFGQYPGRVYDLLLYVIDNEIHHRGQGYVYLRALGVAPPPFYERT